MRVLGEEGNAGIKDATDEVYLRPRLTKLRDRTCEVGKRTKEPICLYHTCARSMHANSAVVEAYLDRLDAAVSEHTEDTTDMGRSRLVLDAPRFNSRIRWRDRAKPLGRASIGHKLHRGDQLVLATNPSAESREKFMLYQNEQTVTAVGRLLKMRQVARIVSSSQQPDARQLQLDRDHDQYDQCPSRTGTPHENWSHTLFNRSQRSFPRRWSHSVGPRTVRRKNYAPRFLHWP
jgi:hypothetical protein